MMLDESFEPIPPCNSLFGRKTLYPIPLCIFIGKDLELFSTKGKPSPTELHNCLGQVYLIFFLIQAKEIDICHFHTVIVLAWMFLILFYVCLIFSWTELKF